MLIATIALRKTKKYLQNFTQPGEYTAGRSEKQTQAETGREREGKRKEREREREIMCGVGR